VCVSVVESDEKDARRRGERERGEVEGLWRVSSGWEREGKRSTHTHTPTRASRERRGKGGEMRKRRERRDERGALGREQELVSLLFLAAFSHSTPAHATTLAQRDAFHVRIVKKKGDEKSLLL
jgi:hypothetical protein